MQRGRQVIAGAAALRHEPPRLAPTALLRGRLIASMRGRFERRLTVITAGAGFGKSTLLAQAVRENDIEQLGIDAWLRLDERDRSPGHLTDGLGVALGRAERIVGLDELIDAVWSRAPASVALIIDDTHILDGADAAWWVLQSLLTSLPANGHVVLSGRTGPPIDIEQHRSADDAVVLGESELLFTDHELVALAELRSVPASLISELPRWPALATLTGVVSRAASIDYLWDEVLGAIPSHRRFLLAAVAPFGEIDDELVAALDHALATGASVPAESGDAPVTAADLVAGLPLVDVTDDGTYRLHDLWEEALQPAIGARARDDALRAGAALFIDRGDHVRAAEAFALAHDHNGLLRVVIAFARKPTLQADVRVIERLHSLLPASMRATPPAAYLEAARAEAVDERRAAELFRRAAALARAAGEVELETLAMWRLTQFDLLDGRVDTTGIGRLGELVDAGIPMARSALAFVESHRAQLAGDAARARACLDELDDLDPDQQNVSRSIRLIDLGLPEKIPTTLEDVLASGVSSIFDAQAVWLQGHIDPELAWPIARELVGRGSQMPATTRVSLNSVVITMGVAAGALDEVAALVEETRRIVPSTPDGVGMLAEVAGALVDLVLDGEDVALARIDELLARLPLGRWPERPYLYAITLLRGLAPGGEVLDGCTFGPAFSTAVDAGAAIASLRAGDPGPATALPWTATNLLRVHVPPPLLAELALAAGDTPGAADLLSSIPHLRSWARRVGDRYDPPAGRSAGATRATGRRARALLRELPERPPYDLHIGLLGRFELTRGDGTSTDGWDRRERVRHLLALVVLEREVTRARAAALLWPDLTAEKAAANLRVNLHHLQRVLEPERDADAPPWFLQSEGARLRLIADGVTVDIEMLDRAMAEATTAEASGSTSRALGHYRRVDELYTGDLLPGIGLEWVEDARSRLRATANAAVVRRGELELARGEPEAAMRLAVRAQRLDPLGERSHRLFIRCQLSIGSVSAARQAATRLRSDLAHHGLPPAAETITLFERLQV